MDHKDPTMTFQAREAMTSPVAETTSGSLDGEGAGDHDVPFKFGRRPRTAAPYPFSTRHYARLLVLRSRIQAQLFGADDWQPKSHPRVASVPVEFVGQP